MDPTTLTFLLIILSAVALWFGKGRTLWAEFQEFQTYRESFLTWLDQPPQPATSPSIPVLGATGHLRFDPASIDPTMLAGAGMALANPPRQLVAIMAMLANAPAYSFPIGWNSRYQKANLVHASLVGDVNHLQVSGFTDSGKDVWARMVLLYLCLTNSPDRLQVAIIDGKGGMSWIGWSKKQHIWAFAEYEEDILPAMKELEVERKRRQEFLKVRGCEKWEEYDGEGLPLLVVLVSEITLLEKAIGKTNLESWLNAELVSARAAGIRYILVTQTFANYSTRFRSQIGLYISGYQPRDDADEPNTTIPTKAFPVDALPPSKLPVPPAGAGVFTCVQGRDVVTVRSSYLDKAERTYWINQLPDCVEFETIALDDHGDDYELEPIQPEHGVRLSAVAMRSGYDRLALDALLQANSADRTKKLDDLTSEPLFRHACHVEFAKCQTIRGTTIAIWGEYSGTKDRVVKAALAFKPAEDDRILLDGLLASA